MSIHFLYCSPVNNSISLLLPSGLPSTVRQAHCIASLRTGRPQLTGRRFLGISLKKVKFHKPSPVLMLPSGRIYCPSTPFMFFVGKARLFSMREGCSGTEDILKLTHKRRQVMLYNIPHNIKIHLVISVYEAIAQTGNLQPFNFREIGFCCIRYPRSRLTDDFKKTDQREIQSANRFKCSGSDEFGHLTQETKLWFNKRDGGIKPWQIGKKSLQNP
jgi:hypothetical protein